MHQGITTKLDKLAGFTVPAGAGLAHLGDAERAIADAGAAQARYGAKLRVPNPYARSGHPGIQARQLTENATSAFHAKQLADHLGQAAALTAPRQLDAGIGTAPAVPFWQR